MKLFLDTSVLIAAAGSSRGASRFVLTKAKKHGWRLVSADYCGEEADRNLPKLGRDAVLAWERRVRPLIIFVPARLALDRPLVLAPPKDRPVLVTALAVGADWLLTLDQGDFQSRLGGSVYGLRLGTPGEFLIQQRTEGRI